jgi:hypothetical protein
MCDGIDAVGMLDLSKIVLQAAEDGPVAAGVGCKQAMWTERRLSFIAALIAALIAELIAKPIDLEPLMSLSRIDHLITGGLSLAVLALVVAVVPIENAAAPAHDTAAFGLVGRSVVASSAIVGEVAPRGEGDAKEEDGAEAEAGASPRVGEGRAMEPNGGTGAAMALGLFVAGMVAVGLWATALSWRTRARL